MTRTITRALRRACPEAAADVVTLDYAARFLRRRSLTTEAGAALFVDLPETVSVDDGDAFVTEAGDLVAVRAAPEPLLAIAANPADLARLAWHIGNRHTPAQIEPARILIQADHVMADMLARLGAATRAVFEPFTPERGAYGHGRTHAHHAGGPDDAPHDHGADRAFHPDAARRETRPEHVRDVPPDVDRQHGDLQHGDHARDDHWRDDGVNDQHAHGAHPHVGASYGRHPDAASSGGRPEDGASPGGHSHDEASHGDHSGHDAGRGAGVDRRHGEEQAEGRRANSARPDHDAAARPGA